MDGDGLPIYPHVLHLVAGAIGNWWQRGGNCHLLRLSMPPLRLPIASSQAGSSSRVMIKHSCSLDACDDTQDIIYCCILILQKNYLCASRSTVGVHTCHPYHRESASPCPLTNFKNPFRLKVPDNTYVFLAMVRLLHH